MAPQYFEVKEHTVQCCHIREYPRATIDANDEPLFLAVKQYIPLDNPRPKNGDVTIIGAHANGFPKEMYEPLWDDLYKSLHKKSISIRSIWIADVAAQGYSSGLNDGKLGNDTHWTDHARDLLMLTNAFSTEIVAPIMGVGHSMGGNNLVNLSLVHPRLFTSLILLEPMILRNDVPEVWSPVIASLKRRDSWPSLSSARASFQKSPFYKSWDPRALEAWIEHGLCPTTPQENNNNGDDYAVTLRTSKHQELFSFMRPIPTSKPPTHLTYPDLNFSDDKFRTQPFYRPEPSETFSRLPSLRPPTLYILGATSPMSKISDRRDRLDVTGTGLGGSGGKDAGQVEEVVLQTGHLVPMEDVKGVVEHSTRWIIDKIRQWKKETALISTAVQSISREDRVVINDETKKDVNDWWQKRMQQANNNGAIKKNKAKL